MTGMNISAYLKRIGYSGPLTPTLETLRGLHRAHLYQVPFENLDIHLGRPIVLDEDDFFDKIVNGNRGGFCYELNGLFAVLLEGLGFEVSRLSGRVYGDHGLSPEFDHLLLRVDLSAESGSWLVDVGFGDNFLEPLPLFDEGVQIQKNGEYRLVHSGEIVVLERRPEEAAAWVPQYLFALTPHRLAEFAVMCRYMQTSPDVMFTRKRICSRATPDGRISLSEQKLIITSDRERTEIEIADDRHYLDLLRRHFAIELDQPTWRSPLA